MKLSQLLAKAAGDGDGEARAVVEDLLTKISGSVTDLSKQAQTLADETVMEGKFQSIIGLKSKYLACWEVSIQVRCTYFSLKCNRASHSMHSPPLTCAIKSVVYRC